MPRRSHAVTCSETCRKRRQRQFASNPLLTKVRECVQETRADAAELVEIVAIEKRQPRVTAQQARIGELAPVKRRGGAEFVEVTEGAQ